MTPKQTTDTSALSLPHPQLPERPFVWFDLDDTLWDMTGNSCIALEQIFHEDPDISSAYGAAGLEAWLDEYHAVNRRLWEQYARNEIDRATLRLERFALPLQAAGMDRGSAEEASRRLDGDYLRRLGDCTGLVEGAREAVDALLRAGIPMGIVSNGFREVQYRKLASGGLDGIFSPIVLSDDAGINKPDRRFFDFACTAAGVTPDRCVIVGDNPSADIAGALDAGWAAALWLVSPDCPADRDTEVALRADSRCTPFTSMAQLPALIGLPQP